MKKNTAARGSHASPIAPNTRPTGKVLPFAKRAVGDLAMPNARQRMLDDLVRSGLTERDARKLGLTPLSSEHVAIRTSGSFHFTGYEIPYFDTGGALMGFARIRFTVTEPNQRYWQAAKSLTRLYIPPVVDWKSLAEDTSKPLIITEGEKKAAKACLSGLLCVALGGVWNFKSKKAGLPLLPDFDLFRWRGRTVEICFDSDANHRADLLGALNTLAHELIRLGARTYRVALPRGPEGEKVGLDDYLQTHNRKDYLILEREEIELSAVLAALNETYAVSRDPPGCVLRMTDGALLSASDFTGVEVANRRLRMVGPDGNLRLVPAGQPWLQWPLRAEIRKLVYQPRLPGEKPQVFDGMWNFWRGWGAEPKKGDVSPWHRLMDHVFKGADKERAYFKRWLAYPIQHPGAKLYTATVLVGPPGAGKSLTGEVIGQLYGQNFSEIDQSQLEGSFNEWARHKQFVLANEVLGTDKRADANRLKNLITRKNLAINKKYEPEYVIEDTINYLLTSNDLDAVYLQDDDRRYFIHRIAAGKLDQALADKISTWYRSEKGSAALLHYLLNEVDISGFNPHAAPPNTPSRQEMVEASWSDLDTWCHQVTRDPYRTLGVERDLWTTKQLILKYDHGDRVSAKAMGSSLWKAGAAKLGLTSLPSGRQRVWAVANQEEWRRKTASERVQHMCEHPELPLLDGNS